MKKIFVLVLAVSAMTMVAAAQNPYRPQQPRSTIAPLMPRSIGIPVQPAPIRPIGGAPALVRSFRGAAPVIVKAGKPVAESASSAPSSSTPFIIWQSCMVCHPQEKLQIWGESLTDLQNVGISVQEVYRGYSGQEDHEPRYPTVQGGDTTGSGYFTSIPKFSTKLLAEDTLPMAQWGEYDILVGVTTSDGTTQSTMLHVYNFVMPQGGDTGPIAITQVNAIPLGTASNGAMLQEIQAVGRFPVGQPMFYWMGELGYDGGFTSVAACTSMNGVTAECGEVASPPGPYVFRGGLALMTQDGSYAAALDSTYAF